MTSPDRPQGKDAVIVALAQGRPPLEAAAAGGISARTLRRWQQTPEFRAEVTRLRSQLLDRTVGALVEAAADAVATLRAALDDDDSAVQVRAARAILSALIQVRESADLEARITALEAAAEQPEDDQP